jgi:hypothetical protein
LDGRPRHGRRSRQSGHRSPGLPGPLASKAIRSTGKALSVQMVEMRPAVPQLQQRSGVV